MQAVKCHVITTESHVREENAYSETLQLLAQSFSDSV